MLTGRYLFVVNFEEGKHYPRVGLFALLDFRKDHLQRPREDASGRFVQ